jgi:hypothetical protein
VKITLPRDVLGFVRRDTQEDKEAQIRDLIYTKLRPCISENSSEADYKHIILSLNVI